MSGFLNSLKSLFGSSTEKSKKKRRTHRKVKSSRPPSVKPTKGKAKVTAKTKKAKKMKGGMLRDGIRPSTWPQRS